MSKSEKLRSLANISVLYLMIGLLYFLFDRVLTFAIFTTLIFDCFETIKQFVKMSCMNVTMHPGIKSWLRVLVSSVFFFFFLLLSTGIFHKHLIKQHFRTNPEFMLTRDLARAKLNAHVRLRQVQTGA